MVQVIPDDFHANPQGAAGNQSGHILAGLFLLLLLANVSFWLTGEIAFKEVLAVFVMASYGVTELRQRLRGGTTLDRFTDMAFVGMGAWIGLTFSEVVVGSPDIISNMQETLRRACIVAAVLLAHIATRVWQRDKARIVQTMAGDGLLIVRLWRVWRDTRF